MALAPGNPPGPYNEVGVPDTDLDDEVRQADKVIRLPRRGAACGHAVPRPVCATDSHTDYRLGSDAG